MNMNMQPPDETVFEFPVKDLHIDTVIKLLSPYGIVEALPIDLIHDTPRDTSKIKVTYDVMTGRTIRAYKEYPTPTNFDPTTLAQVIGMTYSDVYPLLRQMYPQYPIKAVKEGDPPVAPSWTGNMYIELLVNKMGRVLTIPRLRD